MGAVSLLQPCLFSPMPDMPRNSIDIMVFGNVVPIGLQSYGHLCVDTVCLFNEVYLLRERLKSTADKVHIKLLAKEWYESMITTHSIGAGFHATYKTHQLLSHVWPLQDPGLHSEQQSERAHKWLARLFADETSKNATFVSQVAGARNRHLTSLLLRQRIGLSSSETEGSQPQLVTSTSLHDQALNVAHNHTLPHTAAHCRTLPHTAAHCRTLPHTTAHYRTLPIESRCRSRCRR